MQRSIHGSETTLTLHAGKRGLGYSVSAIIQRLSPYLLRYSAFLTIEAGYLAFVITATSKHIPFPVSANSHESFVKSAMITVAVVWQMIALIPVYRMLDFVYSSEWSIIRRAGGGSLRPATGSTDHVSVLTSSWLDRARYALSDSASPTFRLCFTGALLGAALTGIAPATIFVAPLLQETTHTLDIANVTISGYLGTGAEDTPAIQASRRATKILRLEQLNPNVYGFSTDENALIPWPTISLTELRRDRNVTYNSAAVQFSHRCAWYAPSWNTPPGAASHVLDKQSTWTVSPFPDTNWTLWMTSKPPQTSVSGVFPLANATTGSADVSAFLFLGGNSSVHLNSGSQTRSLGVDLSQIASTHRPAGFPLWANQVNASNANGDGLAKLASILVCTPAWILSGYEATVHPGGILSIGEPGDFAPWNLTPDVGATIFSESLLDALQTIEPPNHMSPTTFVNTFAYKLFMQPFTPIPTRVTDPPVEPNDLIAISATMDLFVLSAAKAYLDGYTGSNTSAATISVPAHFVTQVLGIYGYTPFLYATIALIASVAVLLFLAIGYAVTDEQMRDPFTLQALLQHNELRERASQIELARMESQPGSHSART